ncbi:MAG TPA: HEAT repeat domain-containing protein, partial [Roseimicrobium sp.]|nr:HEAT repeat domain-containing protein [Roseimicrobium sp.]
AGLKVGLTIRPTEVVYREGQTPRFWQRDVKDPVALMSEKVTYARKRWGVTVFYLDSNVFGPGFDTQLPPDSNVPWMMPSAMIEQLHAKHPDCLVIPEWSETDNHRFTAPYSGVNIRSLGTNPDARRLYPDGFSVVSVSVDLIQNNWDALLNAVQGGDVLMLPAWYPAPENAPGLLLYREAAIRKQGMPQVLNGTPSPEVLIANSTSTDEATRYYAALLMGKCSDTGTAAALIAMLHDVEPLVRKSALVGLSQRDAIADQKLIDELGTWLEKPGDASNAGLRTFVAKVLGHIGKPAVPRLMTVLQNGSPETASYVYYALGQTGTDDPQSVTALLKPLQAAVGSNLNQETTIRALGNLKAKAAVPTLLKVLNDKERDHEVIRQQAVIALGRIGDKSAIGPLVAEFGKNYTSFVVYSIPQSLDDALGSLTGQKGLVGADDWRRWWAQQRKQ